MQQLLKRPIFVFSKYFWVPTMQAPSRSRGLQQWITHFKSVLMGEADKTQIHTIIWNCHNAVKKNRVSQETEVERPIWDYGVWDGLFEREASRKGPKWSRGVSCSRQRAQQRQRFWAGVSGVLKKQQGGCYGGTEGVRRRVAGDSIAVVVTGLHV